jgi:predicted transcriptional regulator
MKLSEVAELLDAKVVCGEAYLERDVRFGFASDLMSDVLTLSTDNMLLITGMSNLQTIRTAEMADIEQVLVVRNKSITPEMNEIARDNNIVILACSRSMFRAVATLAQAGLQPIY